MDFKLISKNNVGSAVLLLLVISLSQARVFNFLIDTALGRFFLIIFVLCLSHCHKILGVVGVLFIIIMFNSNLYEGFGNSSSSSSSSSSKPNSNSNSNSMPNFNSNSNDSSSTDDSSNSTQPNTDQIKQVITQKIKDASQNNTSDSSDSSDSSKKIKNSKAAEGFDILGIENNIKRGKQSNSIPVNNFMRDADSILPYEGTSFLGSFSPF
jgi:hypothetical protein